MSLQFKKPYQNFHWKEKTFGILLPPHSFQRQKLERQQKQNPRPTTRLKFFSNIFVWFLVFFKFDEWSWLKIYFQCQLLFKNTELTCWALLHFSEDSILEITEERQLKVNFPRIKYLFWLARVSKTCLGFTYLTLQILFKHIFLYTLLSCGLCNFLE